MTFALPKVGRLDTLHPPPNALISLTASTKRILYQNKFIGLCACLRCSSPKGQKIAEIICVQNFYNVALRSDDVFTERLAAKSVAYVRGFPLGGFPPLQSSTLETAAISLRVTPAQIVLSWLLRRPPNILSPETSSVKRFRENLQASRLQIRAAVRAELNSVVGVAGH